MEKLLFVYNNPLDGSYGGSQGTKKAYEGLSLFFELIPYSCIKQRNPLKTFLRNLLLYSGLLSRFDCKKIIHIIKSTKLVGVYFDVSLHGRLVKIIKKRFPDLKIIVNYHNNEKDFYWDGVKQNGIAWLPIYFSAAYNEKLSSKYSDLSIFITKEDRDAINAKGKTIIIPPTLTDYYTNINSDFNLEVPYIVFLGAATAPNIEAARFLIENVAPFISVNCVIAGKGMDKVFDICNIRNIKVYGYVENLAELLSNALAFVSPIFHGSGAKIKIAEALMFGKKIIGTKDSFLGYDTSEMVFALADEPESFITEINKLNSKELFFEKNRKCFCDNYSSLNLCRYYKTIKDFVTSIED